MFYVYVLFSKKSNKLYIGMTSNLLQRFYSHNELGKKGWTINYRPWLMVHWESFSSKTEARDREKKLKGGQGREWIRANFI